jgi:hypothetical protein
MLLVDKQRDIKKISKIRISYLVFFPRIYCFCCILQALSY